MTTLRALLGFAGVGAIVAGSALAGALVRRRWYTRATGLSARLVEAVAALATCIASGLLLGSVGAFSVGPLVATFVVVGAVAAYLLRGLPAEAAPPAERLAVGDDERVPGRGGLVLAGAAVAVVAVRWMAELLQTLGRGFSHTDELHYHLTDAAVFAQSGRTWPVHFPSVGDAAAYHPANSALLHGLGLEVLGSDFLSIFLNLGFAGLALAAAWVLGSRAGNPVAGVLIVAAFLCLGPSVAEAGAALNDTMAIALLLTAAVFLIDAGRPSEGGGPGAGRLVALAGVSAGLAAGTKLTVLVPVVALALLVLALPRAGAAGGGRIRAAMVYVGAASLAGGYWFARNLFATGSPVPALSVGPLPTLEIPFQRSVEVPLTEYLLDGTIWRAFLVPGLERVFGPLWPLLPGLALLAGLAALGRRIWRAHPSWSLLGLAGFVGLAAYAATPTSAGGLPGAPVLFALNLRYAFPALLLCGFAGLAHPLLRRNPRWVVAAVTAAFVASNHEEVDVARGTAAVLVVATLSLVAWAAHHRPTLQPAAAVVAVLGLVAGGVLLQDRYLDRRWTQDRPRWEAYEAMRDVVDASIGITGYPQSYPFFGDDLSNEVVVLGDDSSGDELVPFEMCDDFWELVAAEDLDAVAVLDDRGFAATDFGRQVVRAPSAWLHASNAPVVLRAEDVEMFDVRSALPSCP